MYTSSLRSTPRLSTQPSTPASSDIDTRIHSRNMVRCLFIYVIWLLLCFHDDVIIFLIVRSYIEKKENLMPKKMNWDEGSRWSTSHISCQACILLNFPSNFCIWKTCNLLMLSLLLLMVDERNHRAFFVFLILEPRVR
jgi:hypothetical protein